MAVTAFFSIGFLEETGSLFVSGDAGNNDITLARSVGGRIFVNSVLGEIRGGVPTITNTGAILIEGNAGNDRLELDETNGALPGATLSGGAGGDALTGASGDDIFLGGAGNDGAFVFAGTGNGSDTFDGGTGEDVLGFFGSAASETLEISTVNGEARLFGAGDLADVSMTQVESIGVDLEAGADILAIRSLAGTGVTSVIVDLAGGQQLSDAQADLVEVFGTASAETILVASDADGDVTVNGLAASVRIGGTDLDGRDVLAVRAAGGNDTLDARGDGGTLTLELRGNQGDDFYFVDEASERVIEAANQGDDTVNARIDFTLSANVEKLGLGGTDDLDGTGNARDNTLNGNSGDNALTGNLGRDLLTGKAGADTFVFKALGDSTVGAAGRDTVQDFSRVQDDQLDLRQIDAQAGVGGNQAFDFIGDAGFSGEKGELRAVFQGANTIVSGDVNGDGGADFAIQLKGQIVIQGGDFLL